jgi:hypothetical protein
MTNEKEMNGWKLYAVISLVAMIAITAVSAYFRLWVLTAVPIGILATFGYLSSVSTGRNYPIGITHGVAHAYLLISDFNVEHNFGIPKKIETMSMPLEAKPPEQTVIAMLGGFLIGIGAAIASGCAP